jgi:SAM-dependent methyltransferase
MMKSDWICEGVRACDAVNICPIDFHWLNIREIPELTGAPRIVLFGAGEGSREMAEHLKNASGQARIIAICDNDPSIHGKRFHGAEVIHPARLKSIPFDTILVTSISGRDQIASQLEEMGFKQNRDFYLVGRYPDSYLPAMDLIKRAYFSRTQPGENSVCLNVGPGGSFGLEILLYCYGFNRVLSIDTHRFGANYPELSSDYPSRYAAIRTSLLAISDEPFRKKAVERFDSLFIRKNDQLFFDDTKIEFLYPMNICNLSIPDNSCDFVFSSGVLEHVETPDAAVSGIMRVLKEGGVTLHRIITRDHRSFSAASGCHAFSYRNYSREEWAEITMKKFYQNRILPVEWKELFLHYGLYMDRFEIENRVSIDTEMAAQFHSDFRFFSRPDLEAVNCVVAGFRR